MATIDLYHMNIGFRYIQKGLQTIWNHRVLMTLRRGASGLLHFIWHLIGQIDSYVTLSGLFVFAGLANVILSLRFNAVGGLSVLSPGHELEQALGMVVFGWLLANLKRVEMLTIGSLAWIIYSAALVYGSLSGQIIPQALLAACYIFFGAMAILRANYSDWQRAQSEARRIKERRELEEALAAVKALYEVKATNGRT